jgi:hypothetical protein
MMQAIRTKAIGPTNTKGARIKAYCDARSMTFSRNDAEEYYRKNEDSREGYSGYDFPHYYAARELAQQLGWLDGYTLVGGSINGNECAFVLVKIGG